MPVTAGPGFATRARGGLPTPTALTGILLLYPSAIASALVENRFPSWSDSGNPRSRERRRISLVPSEPAARMTIGVVTTRVGTARVAPSWSV